MKRGKRYEQAAKLVDEDRTYMPTEAIKLIKEAPPAPCPP